MKNNQLEIYENKGLSDLERSNSLKLLAKINYKLA